MSSIQVNDVLDVRGIEGFYPFIENGRVAEVVGTMVKIDTGDKMQWRSDQYVVIPEPEEEIEPQKATDLIFDIARRAADAALRDMAEMVPVDQREDGYDLSEDGVGGIDIICGHDVRLHVDASGNVGPGRAL